MGTIIQQIYIYLVCFVCLLVGAIHIGVLAYDVAEMAAPEAMLSPNILSGYSDLQSFKARHVLAGSPESELNDVQLDELRERRLQGNIDSERHSAVQSAFRAIITISICGGIFLFHWRFGRTTESDAKQPNAADALPLVTIRFRKSRQAASAADLIVRRRNDERHHDDLDRYRRKFFEG